MSAVPSFNLSSRRASERADFRVIVSVGRYWWVLVVRRSWCPRWYVVDHGWWRDRAPNDADELAFRRCAIDGFAFLEPLSMWKRLFEEGFWVFRGEILSIRT